MTDEVNRSEYAFYCDDMYDEYGVRFEYIFVMNNSNVFWHERKTTHTYSKSSIRSR